MANSHLIHASQQHPSQGHIKNFKYERVVSTKFEHPGGFSKNEISENFQNIENEIMSENTFEIGTANAVIRHQMNGERVQWHHATFGFPFTSTFVKALNRDLHVPGLTPESADIADQIYWPHD